MREAIHVGDNEIRMNHLVLGFTRARRTPGPSRRTWPVTRRGPEPRLVGLHGTRAPGSTRDRQGEEHHGRREEHRRREERPVRSRDERVPRDVRRGGTHARRASGGRAAQSDQDRQPQRAAHLLGDVHQPGRRTCLRRLDVRQCSGGERDEGQAVAGAEQQQRHEHGEVPAVRVQTREQQERGRGDQQAADHQDPHAGPGHDGRRDPGHREDHHRQRQERQTRHHRRVPQDVLEELGEVEERPHHPRDQQHPSEQSGRPRAMPEQPERRDRRGRAQLDRDEQAQQRGARDERHLGAQVGPPVGCGAHEAVDQRRRADRRRERADQVEPPGVARGLVEGQAADHQQGQPDRDVDEEDPAPRHPLGQRAAREQADGGAADRDGGEPPQRASALRRLGEPPDEQGQHRRCCERSPDPLDRAGGEQLAGGLREAAEDRGQDETADPGEQNATPPEQVAGAGTEQQEPTEGERVGVDHPGQRRGAEVEGRLDVRQRDVHDRRVEHEHELGGEDRGHDQPRSHRASVETGHQGLRGRTMRISG